MISQTDYAVPTGDFIAEWLEDNGMKPAELARRTGVSRKHVSKVLAGAPVSASFATQLEFVTQIPAERWLALESLYRADVVRLGMQQELAREAPPFLEKYKASLSRLRKEGLVQGTMRNPGQLAVELMSFFRVGKLEVLATPERMFEARFHQSGAFSVEQASLATWLRLAELQYASTTIQADYNENRLWEDLPQIRAMSRTLRDSPSQFIETLAQVGVIVVLEPEVKGSRAYGATFWQDGHPIIVLSARGKNDGRLWFTLFHELGHVLLHPDSLHIQGSESVLQDTKTEEEANSFAADQLIPPAQRPELYKAKSSAQVRDLAEQMDVSPGVLMQHLHHTKKWLHNRGNKLYVRVTISEPHS
ncbi:ImmA/IrrE family metallo-endopeptidase [Propionibacterium freudenreichii]|uniref:ImmA/IrrE family metallo-endopeptidase n=1 Tax=Propionibacterium freudenreichii TaxID=1744 RepID=UPI00255136C8|nr:ImmA/IrrE family metallo-endopeptidase [Propionibacterium freudenreichii]MDK9342145.1 ImmA/IrrE family metallo-endopeptidase [Propionibacterium freudenreichii]